MWRDLEEEAIYMGLTLDYFWSLTPKTYQKHVNAFNKRKKDDIANIDYLNNILGKYISFAINNPKKYPKPFLSNKKSSNVVMSEKDMEQRAINNTLMLGGVIK